MNPIDKIIEKSREVIKQADYVNELTARYEYLKSLSQAYDIHLTDDDDVLQQREEAILEEIDAYATVIIRENRVLSNLLGSLMNLIQMNA